MRMTNNSTRRRPVLPLGAEPAAVPITGAMKLWAGVCRQVARDALLPCAGPRKHHCHRADALLAACDPELAEIAATVGWDHVLEALRRLPACCERHSGAIPAPLSDAAATTNLSATAVVLRAA